MRQPVTVRDVAAALAAGLIMIAASTLASLIGLLTTQ